MAEVVVGVDGSEAAERALRVALREASLLGDQVRVLHSWRVLPYVGAVPGMGYDITPLELEDRSGWAGEFLTEIVDKAQRDTELSGVTVIRDARAGDAGTDLVKASTLADLLVLGTRRHGPFASAVVGSATNYVLHHAQCPVMVVPAATGPVKAWTRVVVGVDGSDCGDSALRWAAERARANDCPLLVVHAWQLITNPDWFGSPPVSAEQYGKQVENWLHEHVGEVLPDHHDVAIELRAVQDYAAAGLLAVTGPEDLLVVGSRGRGSFTNLMLGSVAMQCAHHARSAVTVLRAGTGPTP
jgi:nucleotide-binding universal stress UspA family protein